MPDQHPMTKEDIIQDLRREADELDKKRCGFAEFALNAHKAKIRRSLADKLERELNEEKSKSRFDHEEPEGKSGD